MIDNPFDEIKERLKALESAEDVKIIRARIAKVLSVSNATGKVTIQYSDDGVVTTPQFRYRDTTYVPGDVVQVLVDGTRAVVGARLS